MLPAVTDVVELPPVVAEREEGRSSGAIQKVSSEQLKLHKTSPSSMGWSSASSSSLEKTWIGGLARGSVTARLLGVFSTSVAAGMYRDSFVE